jgi:hypothetical protein
MPCTKRLTGDEELIREFAIDNAWNALVSHVRALMHMCP